LLIRRFKVLLDITRKRERRAWILRVERVAEPLEPLAVPARRPHRGDQLLRGHRVGD
jgi:hypothetical protein